MVFNENQWVPFRAATGEFRAATAEFRATTGEFWRPKMMMMMMAGRARHTNLRLVYFVHDR